MNNTNEQVEIPEEVWEQTRVIHENHLKIRNMAKEVLPSWEDEHKNTCFKDDHGKCKVPQDITNYMNLLLRQCDKLNIEIIELQRPHAQHNENWRNKSQECLDSYAAWANKYDKDEDGK
jgi:hypothetical protein